MFGGCFVRSPAYHALLSWGQLASVAQLPSEGFSSAPTRRSRKRCLPAARNSVGTVVWIRLAMLLHDDDERPLLLHIFSNPPPSWQSTTPLKDFEGVVLNENGTTVILNLSYKNLSGSVNLSHLPRQLVRLHLSNNHLSGTIDLTNLPPQLRYLSLADNQLRHTVDLTKLPPKLNFLCLENNQFVVAFPEALPVGLTIWLSENRPRITKVPRAIRLQVRV
jgi:hypothetical protein